MRLFLTTALALATLSGAAAHARTAAPTPTAAVELPSADPTKPDPFAWLEDIHSPRALAWVKTENERTAARLETDPRYEIFRKQALALFTAKDRIPFPGFLGKEIDNLWQDDAHVKGVWRRTTPASYASDRPEVGDADRPRRAVEGRGQELAISRRQLPANRKSGSVPGQLVQRRRRRGGNP